MGVGGEWGGARARDSVAKGGPAVNCQNCLKIVINKPTWEPQFDFCDSRDMAPLLKPAGGRRAKIPGFPAKIPEKQIAGTYVAACVEKRSPADVKMISDLRYEA